MNYALIISHPSHPSPPPTATSKVSGLPAATLCPGQLGNLFLLPTLGRSRTRPVISQGQRGRLHSSSTAVCVYIPPRSCEIVAIADAPPPIVNLKVSPPQHQLQKVVLPSTLLFSSFAVEKKKVLANHSESFGVCLQCVQEQSEAGGLRCCLRSFLFIGLGVVG